MLDPILIFGIGPFPKMGVAGAAVATVVGQICGALFGIYLNVTRNHEINLNMRGFRPEEKFVKSIYAIGVPSIIMASVTSVMTFLLNLILAGFGALKDTLQSVLGAYFKLQSFIFMPVFGLNNGTVPIISYNYGAGKRTRLVKTIKISALFATSIMLLGLLLMQVFPAQMLEIFKANGEMLRWGVPALRIISVSFIFAGVAIVFTGVPVAGSPDKFYDNIHCPPAGSARARGVPARKDRQPRHGLVVVPDSRDNVAFCQHFLYDKDTPRGHSSYSR